MTVFVDTSAIFALLDADDEFHRAASEGWTALVGRGEELITSNYVVAEASALVARRLGFDAVRALLVGLVTAVRVVWIDERLHDRAVAALLEARERRLSLVDCVSFEVMRSLALGAAFAFDAHFSQRGFECVP